MVLCQKKYFTYLLTYLLTFYRICGIPETSMDREDRYFLIFQPEDVLNLCFLQDQASRTLGKKILRGKKYEKFK